MNFDDQTKSSGLAIEVPPEFFERSDKTNQDNRVTLNGTFLVLAIWSH